MDIYHPEGRHGFPGFGHRCCPAQSSPVHGVSTKVIWCASNSSLYLCAPRPSILLILDLIALPPSPTSPSPTQASLSALMLSIAELIMHLHVRIAFFHSSFVNLAHMASRFLIVFIPDDALNPPSSSPPLHPRRHVLVAGIAVSTTDHHSSSSPAVHCYLSTTDDVTKLLAEHVKHVHNASDSQRSSNSNAGPTHTHQHNCERCYDYDPIRCHSTVVITLFAYVIVSHSHPRMDTLRSLAICRLPEVLG